MNQLGICPIVLWSECEDDLDQVRRALSAEGWSPRWAGNEAEVRESVTRGEAELVLIRLCGRDPGPFALLDWLSQQPGAPPSVLIADRIDVWDYLDAMRRGAFDCVELPLDESELVRIVSKALELRNLPAPL